VRRLGASSLPADTGRHYTKRLIADLVLLVEHEKIRRSPFSLESPLAVLNSPFKVFSSDQDFAKYGIDASLATVKTRCFDDCVLVVEEESIGLVQDV
jgi:hypothetical protein